MVEEVRGGGRGWGSIEPTRVVALPSARNEAPTQGERSCNGLLPFGHHRWRSALWWFRLPPHAFPCVELLPHSHPLRMFPHSQLKSSAWVCSPDPTFQHPALVCSGGHPLRLGGQGRAQYPVYRSHSVLPPHAGCHVLFPGCGVHPSLSAPLRVAGPISLLFLFLFLLSLDLPRSAGILLVLLGVSGPLLIFCGGSVRIVTFADVFLMRLWREINSMSA